MLDKLGPYIPLLGKHSQVLGTGFWSISAVPSRGWCCRSKQAIDLDIMARISLKRACKEALLGADPQVCIASEHR